MQNAVNVRLVYGSKTIEQPRPFLDGLAEMSISFSLSLGFVISTKMNRLPERQGLPCPFLDYF